MRVLICALANAAFTLTVTKSEIFRPLREAILNPWLRKLLSCPYCFSHWGALFSILLMYYGEYSLAFPLYVFMIVTLTVPLMLALGWCLQTLAGLEE